MKTRRDIILGAAELLETKGHTKKQYQSPDGCLCAVAAIVISAGGYLKYNDPEDEAQDLSPDDYAAESDELLEHINDTISFLASRLPVPASAKAAWALTEWNDGDERKKSEVVGFYRETAEELIA